MAWLLPAVPLVTAVAVLVVRRRAMGAVAVGGLLATLGVAVAAAAGEWTAGWSWGPRLALGLSVEGPARLVVALVPVIAAPVVAYAASEHADDPGLPRLLALLVGFSGAMELLVAARDFLTLLVGWELVAAASWALIAHRWRDVSAVGAGQEAFVVTRSGGIGLVLAAGAVAYGAGTISFDGLSGLTGWPAHVAAAGILAAAAAKSAQVPFSPWLFSAMAGPTPVSALLHSATMVAAGAYTLLRLVPLLPGAAWLPDSVLVLGLATALAGGVVALTQTHAKRVLAASTSAQYGLVLVAVGAGATFAAGAHLAAHAALKSLLFLGVGLAIDAVGTADLDRLRRQPRAGRAAALTAVGVLALAAVPPLGAAYSKEQVTAAAGHRAGWALTLVLVAGALSALYAARLFLLTHAPGRERGERPPGPRLWPMGALAAVSVLLGALWIPGARDALGELIGAGHVSGPLWEIAASLGGVLAAFALAGLLRRRGVLVSLGLVPALGARVADWLSISVAGRRLVVAPVLTAAGALAELDDRVVDAGIRGVGRVADAFGRLLAWWGERGVDGVVRGIGSGTLGGATGSRIVDERVVDGTVEGLARGVGATGARSRGLQTGLAHHYYVIVAVGTVTVVAVAAIGALTLGR